MIDTLGPIATPKRTLPPARPSAQLETRAQSLGRWASIFDGPITAIEFVERGGEKLAYAASGRKLHLLVIGDSGRLTYERTVLTTECLIWDMDVNEDVLALITTGGRGRGLMLYDISNLRAPNHTGQLFGEFNGVQLATTRAYLPEGSRGMAVIDVSDLMRPIKVGRIESPSATVEGGHGIVDVRVRGNLAYVAALEAGLVIFDLSDPRAPTQIGQFKTPGFAEAVEIAGDIAYVSNNEIAPFTLWVVDISEPKTPKTLGSLEGKLVSGGMRRLRVVGTTLYYLAFESGYGATWTLGAVNVADPSRPALEGEFRRIGFPGDLEVSDGVVYVADEHGVSVIAMDAFEKPDEASRIAGSSPAVGLAATDRHAFLFSSGALYVIDIKDASATRLVTDVELRGLSPLRIENDRAYFYDFSEETERLRVLDFSNPEGPAWTTQTARPEEFWCPERGSVRVGELCYEYAITDDAGVGVRVFALDNGDRVEKGSLTVAGATALDLFSPLSFLLGMPGGGSITANDGYVYMITMDALYVLDISSPTNPSIAAKKPIGLGQPITLTIPGGAGELGFSEMQMPAGRSVLVKGNRLYVLAGGLWVFDITKSAEPIEIAYFRTGATVVYVLGDKVLLAGPGSALEIVKISPS